MIYYIYIIYIYILNIFSILTENCSSFPVFCCCTASVFQHSQREGESLGGVTHITLIRSCTIIYRTCS